MNMWLRIPDACDACKEASPSKAGHSDIDTVFPFAETVDTGLDQSCATRYPHRKARSLRFSETTVR